MKHSAVSASLPNEMKFKDSEKTVPTVTTPRRPPLSFEVSICKSSFLPPPCQLTASLISAMQNSSRLVIVADIKPTFGERTRVVYSKGNSTGDPRAGCQLPPHFLASECAMKLTDSSASLTKVWDPLGA